VLHEALQGAVDDCCPAISALLGQVLEAYLRADLERAVLDVDTENPTGALGVYTRLGFEPTSRDIAYRLVY
jgi:ribosomal protein S18 acetylase RimI-like enzyme